MPLQDDARWREEFVAADAPATGAPATRNLVYLDHASLGPTPRRAIQAMTDSLSAQSARGSLQHPLLHEQAELARQEYAALIGGRPDQIAHVQNTASGISLIAAGLPWRQGDEVVVPAIDFPSAVLPWLTLEPRGVVVRRVECADGRVDIDALLRACGPRTRVVCVSWVQFSNGYRLDLARLGTACRERGILLVVDGIQGVGALRINVGDLPIDALACHTYKWQLGPQGTGWLYLSDALTERLAVTAAGVRTVTPRDSYFDHRFVPRAGAMRFETGLLNFHGIVGARASMALLAEVGAETIETLIGERVQQIVQGLQRAGCQLAGGYTRAEFQSGIVAFTPLGCDAATCRERLLQAGVIASAREGYVRVSPHFYTSAQDVDAFLEALRDLS
jgi:cysteine desulfurase/selenocysteine lyase